MSEKLNLAYEEAVKIYGQEKASEGAAESIEVFNTNALAGFDREYCESEQLAAFHEFISA